MITQSTRVDGHRPINKADQRINEISKNNVRVPRNENGQSGRMKNKTDILIDGKPLGQHDKIFDLVDIVEEGKAFGHGEEQEIIVIDGRAYERIRKPGEVVFDLNDVVREGCHDEVVKKISEIAERVAREMIPGIAEKVIREEIEKLKG